MGGSLSEDETEIAKICGKELLEASHKVTRRNEERSNELSL